jgi:Protein of unknown function (DUF3761)
MTIANLWNVRVLAIALLLLAPVRLRAQEAASVTCADGSASKGGKGACSHHGGIAKGTPAAEKPAEKKGGPVVQPSQTTEGAVTCKDGTTSPHGGKRACSHHGGIQKGPANDNGVAPPTSQKTNSPVPGKGHAESAPSAPPSAPQTGAATAKCKDGSMSFSKHHSGTCSHHGGVAQWLDGSQ